MTKQTSDRRSNIAIEDAVRHGMNTVGQVDYAETLNTLSHRGVPRVVIERIFVYRQCCRATDNNSGEKSR